MVRLIALGGVAIGLVAFLFFITSRLSEPDMALLYADLEQTDSSQIVEKLEAMGVPYEIGGDGSSIMVPRDRALRLRMSMAEQGLPSGGSIGYEIFDRSDSLGTTNFVQRVNHLRALEGELSRTIRSIGHIKGARVHLVLPERALFAREQAQPTASIIVTTTRGASLDPAQVQSIQHLVAAAVPGLKPGAVSIVDNWGTLLAGGEGVEGEATGATAETASLNYERRVARSVEELLQRSMGYGSVRVEVSADMDFDRITTNSESFDPEGQVVRSTQTVEESSDSSDGQGSQAVTVTNNLPDPSADAAAAGGPSDSSSRTEETVNYEISKKVVTHVREAGMVRRLSVAVLVDGTYAPAQDGTLTYTPRSADELQQIEKLVRSAAGIDQDRGDTVEVVNMRFAQEIDTDEPQDEGMMMGLEKADLMRIGEIAVLAVLGLIALLFIARPLVTRLLSGVAEAASAGLLTGPAATPALALPAAGAAVPQGLDGVENALEQMIDVNQVEGRVRASSIKKVGEIVQKHPEEAVNIIRSWMSQES
jgi:flagellar M-ring protein FliF